MSTGFVHDARYLLHATADLPERPDRVTAIGDELARTGLLARLTPIEPYPAPRELLELVHDAEYLDRLQAACAALEPGESARFDEEDVVICHESWETALLSAGGGLALCDAVMEHRVENGFANIRPPGHHAERHRAMGFCLLANAAIAARHMQVRHGLKKIAIVDWDVHHGNGTQHILESDPSVLFISLHQVPCYPGTGLARERGRGKGRGFTLNIPMHPGSTDVHYRKAFAAKILPALHKFAPEALIISAGFDAHMDDPLAEINLTTEAFGWMTRQLKNIAHTYCQGRLISLLEGGYNLESLAQSGRAHIEVLAEHTPEEKLMHWKSGTY